MMVLNHSVGSGSACTYFIWFSVGCRAGSLMRRCLKARCFVCTPARSGRFSLGASHSGCSQLTCKLLGFVISAEACANA